MKKTYLNKAFEGGRERVGASVSGFFKLQKIRTL